MAGAAGAGVAGRGASTGLSGSTGPCARGLALVVGVGSENVPTCAASGAAAMSAAATPNSPCLKITAPSTFTSLRAGAEQAVNPSATTADLCAARDGGMSIA